ncbi:hypothetical protein ES703_20489 [subsurface metagenome]
MDAVEQLVAALKNKNPNVRAQAAIALGEIKDRRSVKHLISIAKDRDAFVRASVVQALGRIKDSKVFDTLLSALQDESVEVRRNAARAWYNDVWPRYPDEVEGLIAALEDRDAEVRQSADASEEYNFSICSLMSLGISVEIFFSGISGGV